MPDEELRLIITAAKNKAITAIRAVRNAVSSMGRGIARAMGRALKSVFSLRGALATLAGTAGIGAVIKSFVDASSTMEDFEVRLLAMTKSAELAADKLKILSDFAEEAPFELPSVIKAGITLEAFGGKVRDTIKPVADLAAFMGTNIVEASSAFGRAFAAGAGAADILRERGILAMVKLRAGVEDLSKLTLPQFRKVLLETLTDPDGKIFGAVELLKDTFTGQVSIMKDAIFRLREAFGGPIKDAIQDFIQADLTPMIKTIKDWAEANRELIAVNTRDFIEGFKNGVSALFEIGQKTLTWYREFMAEIEQSGIIDEMSRALVGAKNALLNMGRAAIAALSDLANLRAELVANMTAAQLFIRIYEGVKGILKLTAAIVSQTIFIFARLGSTIAELTDSVGITTDSMLDWDRTASAARKTAVELGDEAAKAFKKMIASASSVDFAAPQQEIETVVNLIDDIGSASGRAAENMQTSFADMEKSINGFTATEAKQFKDRLSTAGQFASNSANIASDLNQILVNQGRKKNKQLFALEKAANIATAIVNTATAATSALRTPPPPVGIALAGLISAAGAVKIALIASTNMARGGIVQGSAGAITNRGHGVLTQPTIIAGEGSTNEAFVPLPDNKRIPVKNLDGGKAPINIINVLDPKLIEATVASVLLRTGEQLVLNVMNRQNLRAGA